ncbi:hypothetical protein HaLaN_02856 [Haematococcus lacustris]|uniref:Uncharacterized protein n=1 Tax=Haematococcus lacustris TaxID=44745 RepID=A0A699YM37_HAELA|nr:hypothetical protein HaLaN_02856 [Haematococcus lacustris]
MGMCPNQIAAEDTGAHIQVALLQRVAGVIFESKLCQLDVLQDVSLGDGLASQVAPQLVGAGLAPLGWLLPSLAPNGVQLGSWRQLAVTEGRVHAVPGLDNGQALKEVFIAGLLVPVVGVHNSQSFGMLRWEEAAV